MTTVAAGTSSTTDYEQLGYDAASNVTSRRLPGPGIDETVVWYEGSGTSDRHWLHADERGSVVAVSDGSGNAIAVNRYDEYGIPASTNIGRFQYTGQAWLPELGMYYYKARIYSPTLGRFMQTDPIGYGDGINWYNYVGSDPVNFTDPLGLCPVGFQPFRVSTGASQNSGGNDIISRANYVFVCQRMRTENGGSGVRPGGGGRGAGGAAPASPQKVEPPKPDCMCVFALNNVGSDPVQFATGLVGSAIGRATGITAFRVMNSGEVIGSRVGSTAIAGARAGRIAGVVGAITGGLAGIYFQKEIQKLVNNACTGK